MQALARARIAAVPAAALRAALSGVAALPAGLPACALAGVRWYSVSARLEQGKGAAGAPLSNTAKAKLEKEKRAKRRRAKTMQWKARNGPTFHVDDAIRLVRANSTANFDETVELQVQLALDPRKPNQSVRGVAQLPNGTGKAVSIAVFAKGEKAEEARKAGATYVGAEDLVDKIAKGEIPLTFNKTIATPDVMPLVGKVARILGPRGLMPNPKLGTVTANVKDAVQAAKRGQAEFRVDNRGIIMAGVGKVSFTPDALRENIRSFLLAVGDTRPEGIKGAYMRWAFMKTSQGPSIPLDMAYVDPTATRFMEAPLAAATALAAGEGAAAAAAAAGAAAAPMA